MAAEMIRSDVNTILSSGLHSVETGIANASKSHNLDEIDHAIQSFSWADVHERPSISAESNICVAGFVDAPGSYFSNAGPFSILCGDISSKEVAAKLTSTANFDQGVAEFLQSGIPEALAGLKLKNQPDLVPTSFPVPLDELLTSDKLRNPDQRKLQQSIRAVNEMFTTLRKMKNAVGDMKVNMLRVVRA
jgi:hypothetical protein